MTLAERLAEVFASARGEPPDAIWFFCQDGVLKKLSMTRADPPCEHCDCGYAHWMKDALAR